MELDAFIVVHYRKEKLKQQKEESDLKDGFHHLVMGKINSLTF